jgi:hypothetical protein
MSIHVELEKTGKTKDSEWGIHGYDFGGGYRRWYRNSNIDELIQYF